MKEVVEVPKWFDDWVQVVYNSSDAVKGDEEIKQILITKIIQQGHNSSFTSPALSVGSVNKEDNNDFYTPKNQMYVYNHKLELVRAIIDGYTIKKLYEIKLPWLITTDGEQQYLSTNKDTEPISYFASRKDKNLKQTFTKRELDKDLSLIELSFSKENLD